MRSTKKTVTKFHPVNVDGDGLDFFEGPDGVSYCCGAGTIGEISIGKFLDGIKVRSIKEDEWGEPIETRTATLSEVSKAFEEEMEESGYGLIVVFILDNQHNGDFGKLLKEGNWEYHGSFTNSNTRNRLHHWSKKYNQPTRGRKRF